MDGSLLMVIPTTVRIVESKREIDEDYANNLREYLHYFTSITFACPITTGHNFNIARSVSMTEIEGYERLTFVPLPYPYREDRYLKYYLSVRAILSNEIDRADFLLFSPHAKYDWSTLAANLAISRKRKFGIESDYDHRSVGDFHLSTMRPGLKKLRKLWWAKSFYRAADRCLAHSAIALLQGQEVFDGLKHLTSNPRKVLNVQVNSEDFILENDLSSKMRSITEPRPLQIIYAGRMAEMKGPLEWLNALKEAIELGANLKATWLGEGPMLAEMSREIRRLGLGENVVLPGLVPRKELMHRLKSSDLFLFCHKTGESPRCLGEALVSGTALVGYGSKYPRDLVAEHGGGEFAETGDWRALAQIITSLDRDRRRLATLVQGAARSGTCLDRDAAIRKRIDLIRTYLGR
jgi:glycosyltransferase involved in cell wall biosynthesis